jgi:NADH-quinone oxidoreductase subunit L
VEGQLDDPILNLVPFAVLLLPLVGFVVLALFGDKIRDEEKAARDGGETGLMARIRARGTELAGALACATVGTSFVLSAWSVIRLSGLLVGPEGLRFSQPYLGFEWIDVAGFRVPMSLLLDPLSGIMILTVTGVGFLIHVYSLGYMAHDVDRVRYFSYLNLFIFFMLLLVLGGNLPLMFVGWEGVGLCSYLLIGFWFEKKSASDAGNKAFLVNRVGDAGLLLGMILAFHAFGTLDLVDIAGNIGSKPPEAFGELGVVTAVALLLFVGACGKSAQIPLHVWLPDAMEGPTPVSALIHAATMVTAGVYMVARLAPLYALSGTAMAVVAVVGATTAFVAATIALVQTDIKRVLAYSTVSQLGYMFLACGVGAFGVAIFHLFTHAFFKALLFLGSGSVIHALSGEQDMRKMGGLRTKIPWTFGTFLVGTLAIAGIPPLAGFFSKDAILAGALEGGQTALFAVGLFTALLTAFYMGRLLFLTFLGSFRGGDEAEHHVHESPWTMLGPLVLLAVGSAGVGFVHLPAILAPVFRLPVHEAHHASWLPWVATATAVIGLVAAYYAYVMFTDLPGRLSARLRPVARVLEAKWGFDLALNWLVSRGVVAGSEGLLWRRFDVAVIDGAVNGVARLVNGVSAQARVVQTGLVRGYALVILGGAVTLLAYLLWM